jgi:hypothetical protein
MGEVRTEITMRNCNERKPGTQKQRLYHPL